MNENEYGTPDFNITAPETTHPVLSKLYEQIANLEKQLADMTEREDKQRSRAWELASNFANYKFKLENVLRTHAQTFEGTVIETCVNVADDMGIELTNTKDFEINVTFNVTVAAPFGEEIELSEYDISATLDGVGVDDFEVNDFGVNYINED
jgi:hypothetical protein